MASTSRNIANASKYAKMTGGKRIEELLARAHIEHPRRINTYNVAVGFFPDAAPYPQQGFSEPRKVANVAMWNEYGVPSKNIPERPFMRLALFRYYRTFGGRAKWKKWAEAGAAWKHGFKFQPVKEGFKMQALIKDAIRGKKLPPNAPSTIRKKGYDRPLQWTGRLQRSVRVRKMYGAIGAGSSEKFVTKTGGLKGG